MASKPDILQTNQKASGLWLPVIASNLEPCQVDGNKSTLFEHDIYTNNLAFYICVVQNIHSPILAVQLQCGVVMFVMTFINIDSFLLKKYVYTNEYVPVFTSE